MIKYGTSNKEACLEYHRLPNQIFLVFSSIFIARRTDIIRATMKTTSLE
jgi:hypothetical protein